MWAEEKKFAPAINHRKWNCTCSHVKVALRAYQFSAWLINRIAVVESPTCMAAFVRDVWRKQQGMRVKCAQRRASMAAATINFNAPDLAARVEQASQFALDNLPFGVILLDREGTVQFYSATEARLSGYGEAPLGRNFFAEPLCATKREILIRVTRAFEDGPVDLEFGWKGDYSDPARELRIRVQSSRNGGMWMFIERDILPGA
jgi:photoactive yellow protein